MPWNGRSVVDQKAEFIRRLEAGESMTALCAEQGISRKTGHRLAKRFQERGRAGLEDEARGPRTRPNRTPVEIENLIVKERKERPTWGSKKLAGYLRRRHPGVIIPARSTIDEILTRNGLVMPRRRRKLVPTYPERLSVSAMPNDIWCIDFKGQFRLGNGKYCYPLTIADHFSRFIIACVALDAPTGDNVFGALDGIFEKYGLPKAIRTDNGPPFASRGLGGLSQLSAWWISLGIVPERIDPGCPEQNGRLERMHRTLKEETTRPPALTLPEQQVRFDRFVECFNLQRPHEALDFKTPTEVYSPSGVSYPRPLASIDYPLYDRVYRVAANGVIWPNCATSRGVFLTRAIVGHNVGLRELPDGRWLVTFASMDLGHLTRHGFEPMAELVVIRQERAHLRMRPKATAPAAGTEVPPPQPEIETGNLEHP